MAERFDRLWHHARLATLREDLPDLGVIEEGVIAARDGRIVFAGSHSGFPSDAEVAERIARRRVDDHELLVIAADVLERIDVNRIEEALSKAPATASSIREPMPMVARQQILQLALSLADRTL